jgi:hypothetical protein
MKIYEHKQFGYVMLFALVAVAALAAVFLPAGGFGWPPAVIMLFTALCLLSFFTLTTTIEDGTLKFWFGPGLFRKQVALRDIEAVRAVKNPWYYGWGIHLFPGGWVYNVSGFDAVEIKMKSGEKIRLGTNEPEALERALRQQLSPAPLQ